MELIRRSLGALTGEYLVRAYAIGIAFFVLVCSTLVWRDGSLAGGREQQVLMTLLYGVSTLLFPFSKIVWDEAKRVMLGDNVFYLPLLLMLGLKLFINAILWGLAIFIAPFGLAYLWLRTR